MLNKPTSQEIRDLIRLTGFSQADAAKMAGCLTSEIEFYLSGKRQMSAERWCRLRLGSLAFLAKVRGKRKLIARRKYSKAFTRAIERKWALENEE